MEYPTESIRQVVEALTKLPGVGRKTGMRLALHLLSCPEADAIQLGEAVLHLRRTIAYCSVCHNLSDAAICAICADRARADDELCVVADIRDLIALERTHQYRGRYHVLGGVINPLAGIGPHQLNIEALVERVRGGAFAEVIFALNSTVEGETTAFYIARKLRGFGVRLSHLSRGIPVGSELEYADEATLARSLQLRTPYQDETLTAEANG